MSNKANMSPKETMSICQKLYEGGLITYMRTDSQTYSKEFIDNARDYIEKTWEANLVGDNIDTLIQETSNAHEAIRPTNIINKNPDLTGRNKLVYSTIWNNTLSSLMRDARFSAITLKLVLH